jgi:hypothetical protein
VLLSELDEIAAETAAASLTADQEVDVAVDTDKLAPSQVVSAHQYAVKQAEAARLRAALLKVFILSTEKANVRSLSSFDPVLPQPT